MSVYYIRSGENRIKIGKANDPRKRLLELRTGNPERLELLATEPGDRDVERARHRQFSADRTQGEWFRASPALLRHIADVRAGNSRSAFSSTTLAPHVWLVKTALKAIGVMFLLSLCVSKSDKAEVTPTSAPPAVEKVTDKATTTPAPKVAIATQDPPKRGAVKKQQQRSQRLQLPCRPGQAPPCYD